MHETVGEVTGDAPLAVLDVFPSARPLPDAVRASLEAVKAAQLAARERARREMWQARAIVGGVAALVAISGLVVWPRVRAAKAAKASAAAAAAVQAAPAPLANDPPAAVSAPGGLLAAGVAELPIAKPSAPDATTAASLDACRDSYQGKRWRAAAAACAIAFAAHPDDAKLALRVAEAEYARDHLTEARAWAQRTLALDAKEADALAIIGRSEQRTGHSEAAAQAFRGYLALAPRGWHASEARAALRGKRAMARPTAPVAAPSPGRAEDTTQEGPATEPAAFPSATPAP